jgi:tetratricopeptide (TPR) repeat protein
MLLDPINLGLLVFAWFLFHKAWRAFGDYRRLAPDSEQVVPALRRATGSVSLVASLLFVLALGGFLLWGQYSYVTHFAFPGNDAWKEQQALRHFNEGVTKMVRQPREAETAFRQALPLWQELADAYPPRPEYQHNLAATFQNVGTLLMGQGKATEAEASMRQALIHYEKLETVFPHYQNHGRSRESAQQFLSRLLALRALQEDAAQSAEGHRLQVAGEHRAVVELYRKAVASLEQHRNEFSDQAVYLRLLASKQIRLAWFLVVCPDIDLRDPKQAVELASKAVENQPANGDVWNTLGAAHFREGNWHACVADLEKSMQLRNGGDEFDWLIVAMAYHRLRRIDEANRWLDKALESIGKKERGDFNSPLFRLRWESKRPDAVMLRQEAEGLIRSKSGEGK